MIATTGINMLVADENAESHLEELIVVEVTATEDIELTNAEATDTEAQQAVVTLDTLSAVIDTEPQTTMCVSCDSANCDGENVDTECNACDQQVVVASEQTTPEACDEPLVRFGNWLGYNAVQSSTTWVAGDDFGMTSLESFPILDPEDTSGLTFGTGFHFLSGPTGTADLPPRLFDLRMAYHVRKLLTEATTLDLRLGVGVFSDFETSARKGVRFPGHVVVHTQVHERLATVLGVDVLDRDDVSLLPVAGLIWRPTDDLVFDLVFPRPRIQLRVNEDHSMYLSGELGGGTWAIQRDNRSRDNATYHDLRITCGISSSDEDSNSVFEFGWAFDRELTYRSRVGNRQLDGAFILRWQTSY